jgi:hypothetical protein
MWVAIHMHMEAMLGISLYLYLKLAKPLCFSFYLLCFSPTRSENKRVEQVLPGRGWREVAQTMYTHVNKCKNDKIEEKKTQNTVSTKCVLLPCYHKVKKLLSQTIIS